MRSVITLSLFALASAATTKTTSSAYTSKTLTTVRSSSAPASLHTSTTSSASAGKVTNFVDTVSGFSSSSLYYMTSWPIAAHIHT